MIFRPYWLVRRPFSSQDGPPFGPNSLHLASVRPMILLFRKIACLTYMTPTISILTTQIFRFCSLFGSQSNCGSSPALGGCSAAELHSREPMFRKVDRRFDRCHPRGAVVFLVVAEEPQNGEVTSGQLDIQQRLPNLSFSERMRSVIKDPMFSATPDLPEL